MVVIEVALAIVLLIAPLFYSILARYFDRLMARMSQNERVQHMPAFEEQFVTLRHVLRPLTAWFLARLAVVVLD